MQGTIEDFLATAGAYDQVDRITEYNANMKVMVRLVRKADGAVIWQELLSRSETYPATVDKTLQLEGQDLAAREISRRLSEDLYARLFNAF